MGMALIDHRRCCVNGNGCCAVILGALCTSSKFFVCAARGARALQKQSIPEIVHDEYNTRTSAMIRTYHVKVT